jgi:hypothetical protein
MTTLYAVFGGRLSDPSIPDPMRLAAPEIIGLFGRQDLAQSYWKSVSHEAACDPQRQYFMIPLELRAGLTEMTAIERQVLELAFATGGARRIAHLIMSDLNEEDSQDLFRYLDTIPGFNGGAGPNQSPIVREQHECLDMALSGASQEPSVGPGHP